MKPSPPRKHEGSPNVSSSTTLPNMAAGSTWRNPNSASSPPNVSLLAGGSTAPAVPVGTCQQWRALGLANLASNPHRYIIRNVPPPPGDVCYETVFGAVEPVFTQGRNSAERERPFVRARHGAVQPDDRIQPEASRSTGR